MANYAAARRQPPADMRRVNLKPAERPRGAEIGALWRASPRLARKERAHVLVGRA